MNFKKYITKNNLVFLLIFFIFFLYILVRAYKLSFTYDESHTFFTFVKGSLRTIFLSEGASPTNNHILNSFLTKVSLKLFGDKELFLRLPNVVAFLLYSFSSFKISRFIKNRMIAYVTFLVLFVNPFLLDFFSLSRGYGLSLAFMCLGIYLMFRYFKGDKSFLNIYLLTIAAFLSSISNITALNFYIVSIGIVFLDQIWIAFNMYKERAIRSKINRKLIIQIIILFITLFITLNYVIFIALRLKDLGELYFGGTKNFWSDTIISLIDATFYYNKYPHYVSQILQMLIAISLILGTYKFLKYFSARVNKVIEENAIYISIYSLLILLIISNIVQFYAMHNLYLIERTALLYIPIYIIFIGFLLDSIRNKIMSKFSIGALILITSFLIFNFAQAVNLTYTYTWKNNANIKNVAAYLHEFVGKNSAGIFWTYSAPIQFYKNTSNNLTFNSELLDPNNIDCNLRYLYLTNDLAHVCQDYEIVNELSDSNGTLLKHL